MQTALFVLFFLVLGLTVVLVAMRSGSKGPVLDSNRRGSRRAVAWMLGLSILAFVVLIPLAVIVDGSDAEAEAGAQQLTKEEQHGREVFNQNCVQCHVLAASNSVQQVGPNLDAPGRLVAEVKELSEKLALAGAEGEEAPKVAAGGGGDFRAVAPPVMSFTQGRSR